MNAFIHSFIQCAHLGVVYGRQPTKSPTNKPPTNQLTQLPTNRARLPRLCKKSLAPEKRLVVIGDHSSSSMTMANSPRYWGGSDQGTVALQPGGTVALQPGGMGQSSLYYGRTANVKSLQVLSTVLLLPAGPVCTVLLLPAGPVCTVLLLPAGPVCAVLLLPAGPVCTVLLLPAGPVCHIHDLVL